MAVSSLGPVGASDSEMLERWFFSVIAGALLLIAIVGFAPNSIAIINGSKTNPEFAVHIHAAAMLSWMLLFFIQANLIRKGNKKLHTNVGRALFLLGPIIVLLMVYLAITRFPGGERGPLIAAIQIERILLFSSFLTLGALNRKSDPSMHKRLLLLATIIPLDAALNRMPWLPSFGLGWSTPIWMPVLVLPLCVFDILKLGRIHKATAIGGGLIILFWVAIIGLLTLSRT